MPAKRKYMVGKYEEYYSSLRGDMTAKGKASTFISEVQNMVQEFSSITQVMVYWSGQAKDAMTNDAMTRIMDELRITQENLQTSLGPCCDLLNKLVVELNTMQTKEDEYLQMQNDLERIESELSSLGGKWSYTEGGSRTESEVNSHNAEVDAKEEEKRVKQEEIRKAELELDQLKEQIDTDLLAIDEFEGQLQKFTNYVNLTGTVFGVGSSDEFAHYTLEERLNYIQQIMDNYEEVYNSLNAVYQERYGKGFSFSIEDYRNLDIIFDSFDIYWMAGVDRDGMRKGSSGNNVLFDVNKLTTLISYCNTSGIFEKIEKYINGASWKESGLEDFYWENSPNVIKVNIFGEDELKRRLKKNYGVDSENVRSFLKDKFEIYKGSYENLLTEYREYQNLTTAMSVVKEKISNLKNAKKLIPFEMEMENPNFQSYLNKDYSGYKYLPADKLELMSDKEIALYDYLLHNKSKEEADKYLAAMQNAFDMRLGAKNAAKYIEWVKEDGFTADDLAKTGWEGFKDGVRGFGKGIERLFTAWATEEGDKDAYDYEMMYKTQYIQQLMSDPSFIDQNTMKNTYGWADLNAWYSTSSSVGNMIIPSIIGMIPGGQGISSALFAVSIAGNSAYEARQQGYSVAQAYIYGAITGASEALTEKLLGGIQGLSTKALGNSIFANMFNEGLEEFVQEYLDVGVRALVFGEEIDMSAAGMNAMFGRALEAGKYGALTAGVMQAGTGAISVAAIDPITRATGVTVTAADGSQVKARSYQEFLSDRMITKSINNANEVINDSIAKVNNGQTLSLTEKIKLNNAIKDVSVQDLARINNGLTQEQQAQLRQASEGVAFLSSKTNSKLDLADKFTQVSDGRTSLTEIDFERDDFKEEVTRDGRTLAEYIADSRANSQGAVVVNSSNTDTRVSGLTTEERAHIDSVSHKGLKAIDSRVKENIKAEKRMARVQAVKDFLGMKTEQTGTTDAQTIGRDSQRRNSGDTQESRRLGTDIETEQRRTSEAAVREQTQTTERRETVTPTEQRQESARVENQNRTETTQTTQSTSERASETVQPIQNTQEAASQVTQVIDQVIAQTETRTEEGNKGESQGPVVASADVLQNQAILQQVLDGQTDTDTETREEVRETQNKQATPSVAQNIVQQGATAAAVTAGVIGSDATLSTATATSTNETIGEPAARQSTTTTTNTENRVEIQENTESRTEQDIPSLVPPNQAVIQKGEESAKIVESVREASISQESLSNKFEIDDFINALNEKGFVVEQDSDGNFIFPTEFESFTLSRDKIISHLENINKLDNQAKTEYIETITKNGVYLLANTECKPIIENIENGNILYQFGGEIHSIDAEHYLPVIEVIQKNKQLALSDEYDKAKKLYPEYNVGINDGVYEFYDTRLGVNSKGQCLFTIKEGDLINTLESIRQNNFKLLYGPGTFDSISEWKINEDGSYAIKTIFGDTIVQPRGFFDSFSELTSYKPMSGSDDVVVHQTPTEDATKWQKTISIFESQEFSELRRYAGSIISNYEIDLNNNKIIVNTKLGDTFVIEAESIIDKSFLNKMILYKYQSNSVKNSDGTYTVSNEFGDKIIVSERDYNSGYYLQEIIEITENHKGLLVDDWIESNIEGIEQNLSENERKEINSQIQSIADRIGASFEETKAALDQAFANTIKESMFGQRMSFDSLSSVLDSYIKNQHETGSSDGAKNSVHRKNVERELGNIPEAIDSEDSPIYGMLLPRFDRTDSRSTEFYKNGLGKEYGNGEAVIVYKKDAIIRNTTVTIGDSLDYSSTHHGGVVKVTAASNPSFTGAYEKFMENAHSISDIRNANLYDIVGENIDQYAEIQISGRYAHDISNIEEIVFTKDPSIELLDKLDEAHIPYRFAELSTDSLVSLLEKDERMFYKKLSTLNKNELNDLNSKINELRREKKISIVENIYQIDAVETLNILRNEELFSEELSTSNEEDLIYLKESIQELLVDNNIITQSEAGLALERIDSKIESLKSPTHQIEQSANEGTIQSERTPLNEGIGTDEVSQIETAEGTLGFENSFEDAIEQIADNDISRPNSVEQSITQEETTNSAVLDQVVDSIASSLGIKEDKSTTAAATAQDVIAEQVQLDVQESVESNNAGTDSIVTVEPGVVLDQERNIKKITVSEIDTERKNTGMLARGVDPNVMNMSYQGYDTVYKTSSNNVDVINQVITEAPTGRVLIELDNTTGLTQKLLNQLPENTEIRVIGEYGVENFKGFASNESGLASLRNVTYSAAELKEILSVIENFESGIDPSWDTETKAKYAYDFLVDEIQYNPEPAGGNANRAKNYDGLASLTQRESTCQGFAHTYKELLTRMGIECHEISGSLVGGHSQHAFNVVNIDGDMVIVDTTRTSLGGFEGTGFKVENVDQYNFKSNKELVEPVKKSAEARIAQGLSQDGIITIEPGVELDQEKPILLYQPEFTMEQNKKWENYDKPKLDQTFESTEVDGVTYYIASGEHFKFLAHVIDSTGDVKPNGSTAAVQQQIQEIQRNLVSHPELFVTSGLDNSTISCSTISDQGMQLYSLALASPRGKVILGFNEADINKVYEYYSHDAGTVRDAHFNSYNETVYELGREHTRMSAGSYDEVIISREGRKPSYIISPFPPSETAANADNIKWAKAYGIPIIYINTSAYANQYREQISSITSKLNNGEVLTQSEYEKVISLTAALNSISNSSNNILRDTENKMFEALNENFSKENIESIFEINDNHFVYDKYIQESISDNTSSIVFDAIISQFELDKKFPNLTRDEISRIIKEYAKLPRNANSPSLHFDYELELLEKDSATITKTGEILRAIENGVVISKEDARFLQENEYLKRITGGDMRSLFEKAYEQFQNNPTKNNIENLYKIMPVEAESRIYDAYVRSSLAGDSSSAVFDAIILKNDLEAKYPNLTREQIINNLMESASIPRSRYSSSFKFELSQLEKYANEITAQEILDSKINIDEIETKTISIIPSLVENGNTELIEKLIDKGAITPQVIESIRNTNETIATKLETVVAETVLKSIMSSDIDMSTWENMQQEEYKYMKDYIFDKILNSSTVVDYADAIAPFTISAIVNNDVEYINKVRENTALNEKVIEILRTISQNNANIFEKYGRNGFDLASIENNIREKSIGELSQQIQESASNTSVYQDLVDQAVLLTEAKSTESIKMVSAIATTLIQNGDIETLTKLKSKFLVQERFEIRQNLEAIDFETSKTFANMNIEEDIELYLMNSYSSKVSPEVISAHAENLRKLDFEASRRYLEAVKDNFVLREGKYRDSGRLSVIARELVESAESIISKLDLSYFSDPNYQSLHDEFNVQYKTNDGSYVIKTSNNNLVPVSAIIINEHANIVANYDNYMKETYLDELDLILRNSQRNYEQLPALNNLLNELGHKMTNLNNEAFSRYFKFATNIVNRNSFSDNIEILKNLDTSYFEDKNFTILRYSFGVDYKLLDGKYYILNTSKGEFIDSKIIDKHAIIYNLLNSETKQKYLDYFYKSSSTSGSLKLMTGDFEWVYYINPKSQQSISLLEDIMLNTDFSRNDTYFLSILSGMKEKINTFDFTDSRIQTILDTVNSLELDNDTKKIIANFLGSKVEELNQQLIGDTVALTQSILETNSLEMKKYTTSILQEAFKTDNPHLVVERIKNIFEKNNLPIVGKLYKCFEVLHPNFAGYDFNGNRLSPILKESRNMRRRVTVFSDLIKASFGSNNRSVNNYLNNIEFGQRIFEQIKNGSFNIESLSENEINELKTFRNHLITMYENTLVGKYDGGLMMTTNDYAADIMNLANLLSPNGTLDYNLGDRLVDMFCGFADIKTVAQAKEYIASKVESAERRNIEASRGEITIEEGDLVKGIGDIRYLGDILQNGSIARDYLGASAGTDLTPLDTDLSMIGTKLSSIRDKVQSTAASTYGPIFFILKNDSRFETTRTIDGNTNVMHDPSKIELFFTGAISNDHYGIRTGFASSEINYILMSRFDPKVGLEIAKNGFYIPVIDMDGKVTFTYEDYIELRQKMSGLDYYGNSEYTISNSLLSEKVAETERRVSQSIAETRSNVETVSTGIRNALQEAGISTVIEGYNADLSTDCAEIYSTGSTSRGTNVPGDSDFDYLVKVDRDIYFNQEKLEQLKTKLKENLGLTDGPGGKVVGEITNANGEVLDVEVSFCPRTDRVEFSTDVALAAKLDAIKAQFPDQYEEILANIVTAKEVLKAAHAYKSEKSGTGEGGLGGIGIENWILQHGGSFHDAAVDFLRVADECTSFEEFKDKYQVFDLGENHYSDKTGAYPHENFVYEKGSEGGLLKMTPSGYERMKTALREYLDSEQIINNNNNSNGGIQSNKLFAVLDEHRRINADLITEDNIRDVLTETLNLTEGSYTIEDIRSLITILDKVKTLPNIETEFKADGITALNNRIQEALSNHEFIVEEFTDMSSRELAIILENPLSRDSKNALTTSIKENQALKEKLIESIKANPSLEISDKTIIYESFTPQEIINNYFTLKDKISVSPAIVYDNSSFNVPYEVFEDYVKSNDNIINSSNIRKMRDNLTRLIESNPDVKYTFDVGYTQDYETRLMNAAEIYHAGIDAYVLCHLDEHSSIILNSKDFQDNDGRLPYAIVDFSKTVTAAGTYTLRDLIVEQDNSISPALNINENIAKEIMNILESNPDTIYSIETYQLDKIPGIENRRFDNLVVTDNNIHLERIPFNDYISFKNEIKLVLDGVTNIGYYKSLVSLNSLVTKHDSLSVLIPPEVLTKLIQNNNVYNIIYNNFAVFENDSESMKLIYEKISHLTASEAFQLLSNASESSLKNILACMAEYRAIGRDTVIAKQMAVLLDNQDFNRKVTNILLNKDNANLLIPHFISKRILNSMSIDEILDNIDALQKRLTFEFKAKLLNYEGYMSTETIEKIVFFKREGILRNGIFVPDDNYTFTNNIRLTERAAERIKQVINSGKRVIIAFDDKVDTYCLINSINSDNVDIILPGQSIYAPTSITEIRSAIDNVSNLANSIANKTNVSIVDYMNLVDEIIKSKDTYKCLTNSNMQNAIDLLNDSRFKNMINLMTDEDISKVLKLGIHKDTIFDMALNGNRSDLVRLVLSENALLQEESRVIEHLRKNCGIDDYETAGVEGKNIRYTTRISQELLTKEAIQRINEYARNNPNIYLALTVENTKGINKKTISQFDENILFKIEGGVSTQFINSVTGNSTNSNAYLAGEFLSNIYTRNEAYALVSKMEEIEKRINPSWSEKEKAIYIYDYLKNELSYDHLRLDLEDLLKEREGSKISSYTSDSTRSLRGLLSGKAVCAGYSIIYQELLARQGIEAYYEFGTSSDEGHAWNVVVLDGKTYMCDITFDSTNKTKNGVTSNYEFIRGLDEFSENHSPSIYSIVPRSVYNNVATMTFNELLKLKRRIWETTRTRTSISDFFKEKLNSLKRNKISTKDVLKTERYEELIKKYEVELQNLEKKETGTENAFSRNEANTSNAVEPHALESNIDIKETGAIVNNPIEYFNQSIKEQEDLRHCLNVICKKLSCTLDDAINLVDMAVYSGAYSLLPRDQNVKEIIKQYKSEEDFKRIVETMRKINDVSQSDVDIVESGIKAYMDKYGASREEAVEQIIGIVNEQDYTFMTNYNNARQSFQDIGFERINNALQRIELEERMSSRQNNTKSNSIKEIIQSISNSLSGKTEIGFDKIGDSKTQTYGVDQGLFYKMFNYTDAISGKEYTYRQVQDIIQAAKSRNEVIPRFEYKNASDEYFEFREKMLKKYNFKEDRDVSIIIESIDDIGACSYASVCNEIFSKFLNNEAEFERKFGYPMYMMVDGKRVLNAKELLFDLYVAANDINNGGQLLEKTEDGYRIIEEKLNVKVDPLGRRTLDSSEQKYMSTSNGKNIFAINRFLNSKGLSFESNILKPYDYIISKNDMSNIIDDVINGMHNGKAYSLGIYSFGNPIELRAPLFADYSSVSTSNWREGDGHSIFITGTTQEGFTVSSWGQKYIIPYNDLINSSQWVLTEDNVLLYDNRHRRSRRYQAGTQTAKAFPESTVTRSTIYDGASEIKTSRTETIVQEDQYNYNVTDDIKNFNLDNYLSQDTEDVRENGAYILITDSQSIIGYNRNHGEGGHAGAYANTERAITDSHETLNFVKTNMKATEVEGKYIVARLLNEGNIKNIIFPLANVKSITPNQLALFEQFAAKHKETIMKYGTEEEPIIGLITNKREHIYTNNIDDVTTYLRTIVDESKTLPQDKVIIGDTISKNSSNQK